ncbi:MAG: response regulator [Deltaproteobacteria bacterium]|nr:response regulator [Deltaproteobacteria bacterium]
MKPKLLLIDDEEGIRKILGLSLRDAGYEVITAADGKQGLEYLQQENPLIVLTDIKMPGLDGMEVLQRIKSMGPDTEVIMLTGHGDMDLAIKSLQLEASDFITKPIQEEALFRALRRAEEKLAWKRLSKRYKEDLQIQVKEATDQILRMQKELLQAERLAATGETVAGLAHAIKNILSGLKGGRYLVNQGFERNDIKYLKDGWAMVERNIEKISGLTKDLLTFCREREPEREPVNPNDLIRELFNLFQAQCQQQGVLLILDLDEEMGMVNLDPKGLLEVLTNLIGNALDACTLEEGVIQKPEITIRSNRLPGKKILLEVKDNGMGIDREVGQKIFNIFFSTKGSRGTGLGLLLSRKIVQEHGGEILFHSEPRKGSVFQVILPILEESGGS